MPNSDGQSVDTSHSALPHDIRRWTERLAENVHQAWARKRQADGWRYGPKRDDQRKEHPCLVPFDALPPEEQEYDRETAMETLKAILALGCRILPPGEDPVTTGADLAEEESCAALLRQIMDPAADLTAQLWLWLQVKSRPVDRAVRPDLHRLLGEKILRMGESLLAYDVITRGLELWPQDVRLRQLQALALARTGAVERASKQLTQLRSEGHADEETLGLLARTCKDLALKTADPAARREHLRRAAELYGEAYRRTGGFWTGINAATMALALGETDRARELAAGVRSRCLEELDCVGARGGDRYWAVATLGEAALILGDRAEAADRYASLNDLGPMRFGDLSSTRRNARLILDCLGEDQAPIDRCFHIPRVVLFFGGPLALRAPAWQCWPSGLEEEIHRVIGERLRQVDGRIGYSSAVCGSDVLFLETLLERGGEAHVVLPYDREQLQRDWAESVPQAAWRERCERVFHRAETQAASKQKPDGNIAHEYALKFLSGLATIRARQLETELVRWGVGGELTGLAHDWSSQGRDVELLDLGALLQKAGGTPGFLHGTSPEPAAPPAPLAGKLASRIAAILFADVTGFSKLTEEQTLRFVPHFLGMAAEALTRLPAPLLVQNTWGDALYLVLAGLRDAGNLALDLCERVAGTDWGGRDLPASLGLRVALHAGPVYDFTDPITRQFTCIGAHVSHAARIEPVTPPNQVYASQGFAALAAAEGVTDFVCEYAGQTPLAKGYGVYPTYHVRRGALSS